MRFREEATTRATPERVWGLLSDPSRHGEWNPHVVATEAYGSGSPAVGFRYRITYELSGKSSEFDAAITEFSPPSRFAARLEERMKGDGRNMGRFMIETYDVTPRGARTRVIHEVRVQEPGVNIMLRLLIWLITRLGRPTGKTFMEKFAELAEAEDGASIRSARS